VKKKSYRLRSKVLLYPGMSGWHFLIVPKKQSEEIKKNFGGSTRGWGSLPITATVGKTSWDSSIFPDRRAGAYLLPLKAAVRKKEDVFSGDEITFSLEIRL
jgi:hypothetical protein